MIKFVQVETDIGGGKVDGRIIRVGPVKFFERDVLSASVGRVEANKEPATYVMPL